MTFNTISIRLQQVPNIKALTMGDLISRAGVLTMTEEQNQYVVAALCSPHSSARSSPSTNVTCYRCNIKGHLAKNYWKRETQCYRCGECGLVAGIYVDGTWCSALIDTVCSLTIVNADLCLSWRKAGVDVETIGGISYVCCGVRVVSISMDEGDSAKIDVLVVHNNHWGLICC